MPFAVYCIVTDEEVGGQMGMKILINMPEFKNLNVAFALDEGLFILL